MILGPSDWCAPCLSVDAALGFERGAFFVRVLHDRGGREWLDQLQGLRSMGGKPGWPGLTLDRRARELRFGAAPALTVAHLLRLAPAGEVPEELAGQLAHFAALALVELPRVAVSVTLADLALSYDGAVVAEPRLLVLEGTGYGAAEPWQPPLPALAAERDHVRVLEAFADALGLSMTWDSLDAALAWTAVYGPPEPDAVRGWMRGVAEDAVTALEELEDCALMGAPPDDLQRLWRPLRHAEQPVVRARVEGSRVRVANDEAPEPADLLEG